LPIPRRSVVSFRSPFDRFGSRSSLSVLPSDRSGLSSQYRRAIYESEVPNGPSAQDIRQQTREMPPMRGR